jgi:hypothetical protein
MKKKDIVEVALKIFGACIWLQILASLDNLFILKVGSFSEDAGYDPDIIGFYFMLVLLKIVVLFFTGYYFIFKSALIAGKIVKENEDNVVLLPVERADILKIAVIIIGGVTLVTSLPLFFDELRTYYINYFSDHSLAFLDYRFLLFSLIQVLTGGIFFFMSDFVTDMLFKKATDSSMDDKPSQ